MSHVRGSKNLMARRARARTPRPPARLTFLSRPVPRKRALVYRTEPVCLGWIEYPISKRVLDIIEKRRLDKLRREMPTGFANSNATPTAPWALPYTINYYTSTEGTMTAAGNW